MCSITVTVLIESSVSNNITKLNEAPSSWICRVTSSDNAGLVGRFVFPSSVVVCPIPALLLSLSCICLAMTMGQRRRKIFPGREIPQKEKWKSQLNESLENITLRSPFVPFTSCFLLSNLIFSSSFFSLTSTTTWSIYPRRRRQGGQIFRQKIFIIFKAF